MYIASFTSPIPRADLYIYRRCLRNFSPSLNLFAIGVLYIFFRSASCLTDKSIILYPKNTDLIIYMLKYMHV